MEVQPGVQRLKRGLGGRGGGSGSWEDVEVDLDLTKRGG